MKGFPAERNQRIAPSLPPHDFYPYERIVHKFWHNGQKWLLDLGMREQEADHFMTSFRFQSSVDFDLVFPVGEGAVTAVGGSGNGSIWKAFIG